MAKELGSDRRTTYRKVGHRIMLAESMVGLASVDIALGRLDQGARLIGYAEALAETLWSRRRWSFVTTGRSPDQPRRRTL